MSKINLNAKEIITSINLPPPPIQNQQKLDDIGYNCSECSSLIEIMSINEDENCLSFKCINNDNHNTIKIKINNYLDIMKNHKDNKNLNAKCEFHNNNEYLSYCFDCKYHLCKECLKSKIHKNHNKIYLFELQPNDEELKVIKNKIENYYSRINNLKKEKEYKIKLLQKELYNHQLANRKNFDKIISEINKRNDNEIMLNKNKYIKDIEKIKIKYYEEIKLRKIKFEEENNLINKKYKMIKSKEILIKYSKNKKIDKIINNNKTILLYDKQINNLLNILKINNLIYNTFNKCNNNYYYSINLNNLINNNFDKNRNNINNEKEENNVIKINNNSIINDKEHEKDYYDKKITNFIKAEIIIDDKNINKNIRILNSFEEFKKNYRITNIQKKNFYKYENEKEIRDNCEIQINNNIINFSYFFEFKSVGKYI